MQAPGLPLHIPEQHAPALPKQGLPAGRQHLPVVQKLPLLKIPQQSVAWLHAPCQSTQQLPHPFAGVPSGSAVHGYPPQQSLLPTRHFGSAAKP